MGAEIERDVLVSGKYRVLDRLGAGGMGAVYSATHIEVGRKVALKFLRADLSKTPGTIARFRREAHAAGSIGHENILEVYDVGETPEGMPFIVMELLEGESLARMMHREKRLPTARAAHLVTQVLSALGAAHKRGIVHRDLKPENIFLTTRAGQTDFVKVLDFGISTVSQTAADTRLTQTGDVLGTPPYMAPEQARGETVIDHRADLWAIGVVLFEMVTGKLPFPGENGLQVISKILTLPSPRPSSLQPEIPPAFDAVVLKALDKDKTTRFQNAGQFYEALVPFLLEGVARPFELTPPTPVTWTVDIEKEATRAHAPRARRQAQRRKILSAAAGLVLVLGVLGLVWSRGSTTPVPARATESAPPPAPAPEAPGVALQINATPASARIELDGALVEGNPATVRVARGGTAVRLRVQAPGHVAIERWIAPDRDRAIEIALAPEPQAAAPAVTQEPASRGKARSKSTGPRRPAGGGGSDIFTDLRGPR